ncbi:MAG: histone deacetylase [Bryobacteraceae bacterium]|nr:histone deacetylase [Bryobacteraceae bacterium]
MLPFPAIYHDGYDLNFGKHVFPTKKYRLIRDMLAEAYGASNGDFHAPEPAPREDLMLVHSQDWIKKLETGTLTYQEVLKLEAPYSRQMVQAYFLAAGGTLLAARESLRSGMAMNIGGGFHHAFTGHGEGFCAVNDIAVAVRALQREGKIRKAMVVDCDVHHGNGTASIFASDASVFTLSIHQRDNYPAEKPPSSLDIHLADATGDREYVDKLGDAMRAVLAGYRPDLVMYVAGSDPFHDDQLGGLSLTKEGMLTRDRLVFETAFRGHVPVCVTLAGGYAHQLTDTVRLHAQTYKAAVEAAHECGWPSLPGASV